MCSNAATYVLLLLCCRRLHHLCLNVGTDLAGIVANKSFTHGVENRARIVTTLEEPNLQILLTLEALNGIKSDTDDNIYCGCGDGINI
jgi:hypothetical protein